MGLAYVRLHTSSSFLPLVSVIEYANADCLTAVIAVAITLLHFPRSF